MKQQSPLTDAASLLVRTSLKILPNEHLVIVDDERSHAMGDAVAEAAERVNAWVRRVRLDRIATRPLRVLPDSVRDALMDAQASIFLASEIHHEASMRQAILHVVRERSLRHAHMPGITERAFWAGVRVDYNELATVGERVRTRMMNARTIVTESAGGTELRVELRPGTRWSAQLGVLTPGVWGSLPGGAIYASPEDVEGIFVADASLGEFFGARAGLLASKSVRLTIHRGRVVGVDAHGGDEELARDLRATLQVGSNSDRVGLVAIGVNYAIERAIGDVSVDQNIPGLHLGIGDPAGKATGATWGARTCFAACQTLSRVAVDGVEIIRDGALAAAFAPRVTGSLTPSGFRVPMRRSLTPPA